MRILFVHQNFPAQFRHLASHLALRRGHEVLALGLNENPLKGVKLLRYQLPRQSSNHIHPWVAEFEAKAIRAEGIFNASRQLRKSGFVPDVIYAHSGWGEAMALKEVFPDTRLVCYSEFYYRARGLDVGFDPEFSKEDEFASCRLRMKNGHSLISLEACDAAVAPTEWQRSTYPREFQQKIRVIHDGIDTQKVAPNPLVQLRLHDSGIVFRPGDEIITFVNRNLEPYRGYHIFMRALPAIMRARPHARVLIVGGEGVSYGSKSSQGKSWKQIFLDEVAAELDLARVHFLGNVPYESFLALLQVSACHVYLTYPFVLSWSCLEAMSAGCLVVGSATPPVQEVIEHGRNGLLVDFFDVTGLADTVIDALGQGAKLRSLRTAARADSIARYDLLSVCLPQQVALLEAVV